MISRPILFNGAMVRALISGAKTQTRRPCPLDLEFLGGKGESQNPDCWGYAFDGKRGHGYSVLGRGHEWRNNHDLHSMAHPHGEAGDELYVRETWTSVFNPNGTMFQADNASVAHEQSHPKGPHYNRRDLPPGMLWRPSIHMPRWASRITLGVREATVARIQDITEEQAKAEGVTPLSSLGADQSITGEDLGRTHGTHPHVLALAVLWDTVCGDNEALLWKSNPWVWVTRFELKAVIS